jgi:hypothetical protein
MPLTRSSRAGPPMRRLGPDDGVQRSAATSSASRTHRDVSPATRQGGCRVLSPVVGGHRSPWPLRKAFSSAPSTRIMATK